MVNVNNNNKEWDTVCELVVWEGQHEAPSGLPHQ